MSRKAMWKPPNGSQRLRLTLQALSLLFLGACQTPTGSCELLTLKEYDEFFKAGLAYEVAQMGEASPALIFIRDGIALRDSVRACKGE